MLRLSTTLLPYAAGLIGIYLLYAGVLFVLQRRMIFPGQFQPAPQSTTVTDMGRERFWIETNEAKSEVWLLPGRTDDAGPRPAVIVAHGNAELIDYMPELVEPLRTLGLTVVLVEYPGYGRSEGTPSQESITKIFAEAHDRVAGRPDVDASRIIGYGRSVGGGAICQLATIRPLAALILQSTFTDVPAFAADYYVPGFLVRDEFNNRAVLQSYEEPVLIVHGRRDRLIPFDHARRLEKASPTARLIDYECGHNNCPPDSESFWRDVAGFLRANDLIDP